jgi:hypothetical protein
MLVKALNTNMRLIGYCRLWLYQLLAACVSLISWENVIFHKVKNADVNC